MLFLFESLKSHTDLLDELNAGSQVHPEVDELPIDAFLLVLLLLQHEHVVVEELLQLLVGEVDAQLLQAVELHREAEISQVKWFIGAKSANGNILYGK